jgi:hypothetical protein
VTYLSHNRVAGMLLLMRHGAAHTYRRVGVGRSQDGRQWSISGGPWLRLLPAMDAFMRAAGLVPVWDVQAEEVA